MSSTKPRRVAARPDPSMWADDELMTFAEAASLMWPQGPLTASSLRTAYRAGGASSCPVRWQGMGRAGPASYDARTQPRATALHAQRRRHF